MIPTEQSDQLRVADWLRWKKILFHHSPNEGRHKVQYRMKQARSGVSKGFPDLIILDPPPALTGIHSVAIELKRAKGGRVSDEQNRWLLLLEERGWFTAVCHGADDAIKTLERLGY